MLIFRLLENYLSEQASKLLYSLSNLFTDSVVCIQDKIRVFDALLHHMALKSGNSIKETILRK